MNEEKFIVLDESYLPQMGELFKNAFAGEPWNDDWSDPVQLGEYIKEISGSYNALNFGLVIDGRLAAMSVGMIRHWWEGTNYNIEELCVSPEYQHQGIGSGDRQKVPYNDRIRDQGQGICRHIPSDGQRQTCL